MNKPKFSKGDLPKYEKGDRVGNWTIINVKSYSDQFGWVYELERGALKKYKLSCTEKVLNQIEQTAEGY